MKRGTVGSRILVGAFPVLLCLSSVGVAEPLGPVLSPGLGRHCRMALGDKVPRGWDKVGKVEGLLGEDWYSKKTTNTVSYAREGDLPYVNEVVEGLEGSYQFNRSFLGLTPPRLPLEFYFCGMAQASHQQPRFQARLRGASRFAGIALGGTKICCINLGDARTSQPYPPWEMAETARHEMNHLFAFSLQGSDTKHSWGWLYEALAHTAENTIKPPSAQVNLALMKSFMKGYRAVDSSWAALVKERDNQEQEQYREYDKILISIIYYLQDAYGRDCIARLMANCRGRDLEDAFVATFGKGSSALEAGWKAFYGIR